VGRRENVMLHTVKELHKSKKKLLEWMRKVNFFQPEVKQMQAIQQFLIKNSFLLFYIESGIRLDAKMTRFVDLLLASFV
jgi:hypothetical protein